MSYVVGSSYSIFIVYHFQIESAGPSDLYCGLSTNACLRSGGFSCYCIFLLLINFVQDMLRLVNNDPSQRFDVIILDLLDPDYLMSLYTVRP